MEHKNEGNIHFKNKDYIKAKDCYQKAIIEDPTNIIFYSNLAAVHLEENDCQECIATCKKAVKIGTENKADFKQIAKVSARMGRAYMKDQHFRDAANSFKIALEHHKIDDYKNLLSEAIFFLKLEINPPVEVKPSNVHGRGVFAVRDIKEDEIVCLFDGKLVTQDQLFRLASDDPITDREYLMAHPRDPELFSCGYKTPRTVLGVGQLINDFAKPEITNLDFKHGVKAREEYVMKSKICTNVTFCRSNISVDGKEFWLYARIDIKKGEELFLHYDYKTWIETLSEQVNENENKDGHLWKLLYWALGGGEIHMQLPNGRIKTLRIEDAENWQEVEYGFILGAILKIPDYKIEILSRIPTFSYKALFMDMLNKINMD